MTSSPLCLNPSEPTESDSGDKPRTELGQWGDNGHMLRAGVE